jgi:hypothetical protein
MAERRRAAWLSDNPFGVVSEGGAATIIGTPKGDTIARVAARVGGKTVIAAILGIDEDVVVGTQLAEGAARRFEGDPTVVAFDSITIAQVHFANVPATVGPEAATLTLGAAALGRRVMQIDYARNRIVITKTDVTRASATARHPLARERGQLRVLDRGRWISLSELAATVARSRQTLVIDVAAGEVRVRP